MSKPALNSKAPDFTAPVIGGSHAAGDTVTLSQLQGQKVVMYFYPKDDTPGCTKQACGLRDGWKQISKKTLVFGVSTDSLKSHAKFIQKHELPFPLIADEDKKSRTPTVCGWRRACTAENTWAPSAAPL